MTMCRICRIVNGHSTEPHDSPLFESKNYFAITSVGALVPGWLLIFPKAHTANLAQHYDRDEFVVFRREVATRLESTFSAPVRMFEHGPVCHGSQLGCGVDHAHLHVVPLPFSIESVARKGPSAHSWTSMKSTEVALNGGNMEYLLCSDNPNEFDPSVSIAFPSELTSQFFRRIVAAKLGRETEYDYKFHRQLPTVRETTQLLGTASQRHSIGAQEYSPPNKAF
jgi:ATP adenylyltransferase